MPLYDYRCNNCEHRWTDFCGFDEHPKHCPECETQDQNHLERLISMPNIRMDGREGMSVKHTTSEYFGPQGRVGKEEYFPEERKRKADEQRKKQEKKGPTIGLGK